MEQSKIVDTLETYQRTSEGEYIKRDKEPVIVGLIRLQRIYNFDCSMLLYYPSRMFYMHLYAILYEFWD